VRLYDGGVVLIESNKMSLLKIGDVAKRTGLTVRALHHYDEIGLLKASHRSNSGYRLYTVDDLMQLQKIKSLQQLGFSLDDIARLLQSDDESLADIINKQLQTVTDQLKEQQVLIQRLSQLATLLQQGESPTVEMLLDSLRLTVMFEKYYTKEQLEELAERREAMGDDAINQVQNEWQEIFTQFQLLQQAGELASCDAAQKLAKRSLELVDMFTGGDPELQQSLQNMYDTEGGENVLGQSEMAVDKVLFAYVSEAMALAKSLK
tara:strand:+ start:7899 stop:8687 length:789 start_codon:yes stop_codon:yes gene_type:complete